MKANEVRKMVEPLILRAIPQQNYRHTLWFKVYTLYDVLQLKKHFNVAKLNDAFNIILADWTRQGKVKKIVRQGEFSTQAYWELIDDTNT